MAAPEAAPSQNFSSPVIDGELNIFNDSNLIGQHDPKEGFAFTEQSDVRLPGET